MNAEQINTNVNTIFMKSIEFSKNSNDKFWDKCFPDGEINSASDDNSGYVPTFIGEIYAEDVAYYTRWSVSLVLGE